MQRQTVLSDSSFPKYSSTHVAIFNTTAWPFLMQCQRSCTFTWGFLPCPTQTEISLDPLNLFTILCMVVGERPKFLFNAILHWKMRFFLFLLSWNLAQRDELLSSFACKDWDAPFTPNHDPLTSYQFTCLLWTVSFGYSITFNFYYASLPTFFRVCCNHQNQNLFIFTKYI